MKFWFVYEHTMGGQADTKVKTVQSVFCSKRDALQFIADQDGNEGRPLFRGYTYEEKEVNECDMAWALSMVFGGRPASDN